MTYLRHASRHVHHSVANYLQDQLDELGWSDPEVTPFGATPATLIRTPAIVGESLDKKVTAGTVAITLGDEYGPDHEEMGGPLHAQEYPLFIDIFQSTSAEALALASDIRDVFLGRLPGTQRWLDVTNQVNDRVVPGWKLEFEDVERVQPETVMPLRWQVVKVTAVAYFPEVTHYAPGGGFEK